MRLLSIETSCEHASLALLLDGALVERQLQGSGAQHSGSLLPSLHQLLAETQVSLGSLDAIAFGNGPGAFTGVRLACGVAQGLALGVDRPVAPVGSLAALVEPCGEGLLYAAMDARMNEIYVALYARVDGQVREVQAPGVFAPQALPVPPAGQVWRGVGNAFTAYAEAVKTRLGDSVQAVHPQAVPTAAAVARLAAAMPQTWIDPALAAPLYVRDRVALTVEERLQQGGRA